MRGSGQSSQSRGEPLVAHLISSKAGAGGAERVVGALARAAVQKGWRATVLNPFATVAEDRLDEFYRPAPYYRHLTVRYAGVPAARRWASATIADLAPDIVHVHLYHATVMAATMPSAADRHRLLTHHYGALLGQQGRHAAAMVDRWAARRFPRVVAVSEAVRDYLVGRCGLAQANVMVIRNGWGGRPLAARLEGSPPTVVCVANFRPEKGHDVLLKAFAEVARAIPSARLLLAGGGPKEQWARREVLAAGLAGSVEFLGTVQEPWEVLARGDVFALASWYEGLGLGAEEAMAAGLPVVATAVGGLREVVVPGRTGWLVPAGDHVGMAQRITQLLMDHEARRRFGTIATELSATMTEAVMVSEYFELYNSLLAQ